jgi:hypothetical protein
MSRSDNMLLRAKLGEGGNILGFELGNYSGGDSFVLRVHRLARGDAYWVVEGNGYKGTVFVARAEDRAWESNDLDELGHEILRLWRADVLQKRDAQIRDLIRRLEPILGPAGELPTMLPTMDELRRAEKEERMSESPRDAPSL